MVSQQTVPNRIINIYGVLTLSQAPGWWLQKQYLIFFFFTILQFSKQDLTEVMESQGRVTQLVAQRWDPALITALLMVILHALCWSHWLQQYFSFSDPGQGQPLDHCLWCWSQIWFRFFYLYMQDNWCFLVYKYFENCTFIVIQVNLFHLTSRGVCSWV